MAFENARSLVLREWSVSANSLAPLSATKYCDTEDIGARAPSEEHASLES